ARVASAAAPPAVRAAALDLRPAVPGGNTLAASCGNVGGASRPARALGLPSRRATHFFLRSRTALGNGREGALDRAPRYARGLRSCLGADAGRDRRGSPRSCRA